MLTCKNVQCRKSSIGLMDQEFMCKAITISLSHVTDEPIAQRTDIQGLRISVN